MSKYIDNINSFRIKIRANYLIDRFIEKGYLGKEEAIDAAIKMLESEKELFANSNNNEGVEYNTKIIEYICSMN